MGDNFSRRRLSQPALDARNVFRRQRCPLTVFKVREQARDLLVVQLIDELVQAFPCAHGHMITQHRAPAPSKRKTQARAARNCSAASRTWRGAVPPVMSRAARAESTVMSRTSRSKSALAAA